jgi:predicted oxidoreductase
MNILVSPTGPTLSRLVAGTMKWGAWGARLEPQSMLQLMEHCITRGITTFDHADIYGDYTTEGDFGRALKLKPSLRQEMQLVSKCGICLVTPNRPHHSLKSYDTSYRHILDSVDNSLRELQTDYLDLLLIHRPDPLLATEEVAKAFTHLREQGKVRYFGTSNFTVQQFDALKAAYNDLVTNQVEASLLHRNALFDGTLDQMQRHRILPMAWSPLGGGKVFTEADDPVVKRIRAAASPIQERLDASLDQVLLAWLLMHPARILPVLGTSKIERIATAARSLDMQLSREEWFSLLQAAEGKEVA